MKELTKLTIILWLITFINVGIAVFIVTKSYGPKESLNSQNSVQEKSNQLDISSTAQETFSTLSVPDSAVPFRLGTGAATAGPVTAARADTIPERKGAAFSAPISIAGFPGRRGAVARVEGQLIEYVACRNPVNCIPPEHVTFIYFPTPFNAPVRFGKTFNKSGMTFWSWIKENEPSEPCTEAQKHDGASYEYACKIKIGEVLFWTPMFQPNE